ncbi:MAG: hypothetical protein H7249_19250 [Chitinophagaceae bacterium]|nr:hypothetical protein [Oligoflexus sp.]
MRRVSTKGFSIEPLPLDPELFSKAQVQASEDRWDKADVHSFTGTYGEYLLAKVGKVFPKLKNTPP